eukprot:gene14587-20636_t
MQLDPDNCLCVGVVVLTHPLLSSSLRAIAPSGSGRRGSSVILFFLSDLCATRFSAQTENKLWRALHEVLARRAPQPADNGPALRMSGVLFPSVARAMTWAESQGTSSVVLGQDKAGVLQDKVGVLLLNLGGPETLADVKPFLYNLFVDPDIIRLPKALRFLQPVVAQVISSLSEAYQSIGGGSPLRRITDDQANALAGALRAKGTDANVYVAMRYWHPFTEEALEQVKKDGVGRLVILPLYPQFSISTSGSSLRLLETIFKEDAQLSSLHHTVIPSW